MKGLNCTRRIFATLALGLVVASVPPAYASGFRIPEISIAGLGTSNALVANPNEPGALPYNPAAMAFQSGGIVGAGLIVIDPATEVKTATASGEIDTDTPFLVPNLFLAAAINQDWKFGLNVNAPFGLETKYKPGTFPGFVGPLAAAHPTVSQLKMVNINPNVAVKLNPTTSLAFGIDYMKVDAIKFDSVGASLKGDGQDWGWNIGFLWADGPWSAGASYRSGASIDIDGSISSTGVLGAEALLELPAITQIGVRYAFTPDVAVEFDIDRTEWSSFDELKVKATTGAGPVPAGTTLLTSTNDWKDVTAYRIALTWNLSAKTQLRFGYAIDETPQEDKNFSARIPDADRQLFSFGVKQDVGGWDWEGGVMYVLWDDRKISSTAPPAADPNGTSLYNGTYESDAWLIGVGVTKKF